MDEQLHIIVAGDKGKVLRLPCSKKKLCFLLTISVVTFLVLTITSICSFSLYNNNRKISNQLVDVQEKLHNNIELAARTHKSTEAEQLKLDLEIARLELYKLKEENALKDKKESVLAAAVDELQERSELIERIFGNLGIKMVFNKAANTDNSGGLFIQQPEIERDELLFKADKYLHAINYLPLGRPVKGPITSRFGKRKDPLNRKSAFHTGIDFRGKRGEKIRATADGVVKKACRNGGYGNYLLIDHGNGYTSSFAHMHKYLVHKGDRVLRGQVIGLIGNTGRSTGPHLHYEIALDKKPINPYKFLKVASLAKESSSAKRKK